MPTVVLISDLYGRFGDHCYMDEWADWWLARGFDVHHIYMDELLPGYHERSAVSGAANDGLHARLTAADAVTRAQQALRMHLAPLSAQVVLGFSYGGFLAGCARDGLTRDVTVVCISATRLRYVLPLPVSQGLYAVFGAIDPFKPEAQQLASSGLATLEVPNAGHEVYRDVAACAPFVEAVVLQQWRINTSGTAAAR